MGFVYRHVIEVNAGVKIPEERAWDYFIDILLGVEYCESQMVLFWVFGFLWCLVSAMFPGCLFCHFLSG
jgi:hypothetical protein